MQIQDSQQQIAESTSIIRVDVIDEPATELTSEDTIVPNDEWYDVVPTPRLFTFAKFIALMVGSIVLVSVVGFLTTAVYDAKMQMPVEYAPSRMDYPIVGLSALLPMLMVSLGFGIVLLQAKYLIRFLVFGVGRLSQSRTPSESAALGAAPLWQKRIARAKPETIADMFLVAAIVATLIVISSYRDVILALTGGPATLPALACGSNPLSFLIAFSALAAAIAIIGRDLRRFLQVHRASSVSIARVRWGALLMIAVLIVLQTLPWRVMWSNHAQRAEVNGELSYILVERGRDLVIYNAERRATQLYRAEVPAGFKRLNTAGYVFEGDGPCRSH